MMTEQKTTTNPAIGFITGIVAFVLGLVILKADLTAGLIVMGVGVFLFFINLGKVQKLGDKKDES
jgi:hypothetical protein